MSDDPFQSQEWLDYAEHARTTLLPIVEDSSVSVTLVPDGEMRVDVKLMLELGASLILGRPLILVVTRGSEVPDGLARAADAIIEWNRDGTPESDAELQQHLYDALNQIVGEA